MNCKTRFFGICLFASASMACGPVQERNSNMVQVGPDAAAGIIVYFKRGATEAEIEQCYRNAIYVPRPDARGEGLRDGYGGFLRLLPSQAHNYEAIAVDFTKDSTVEQRGAIKDSIISCGIVHKVFENIAPKDIKASDL